MDTQTKSKIKSIINCFETSTTTIDYDKISIFNDGPGNIKQITLSKGATEWGGALRKIVTLYVSKNGKYSDDFRTYVDGFGSNEIGKNSLVYDKTFINLLIKASREDQLMRDAQEEIYESVYFAPALAFFEKHEFKSPLALLVIYDSYIHSGSVPDFLRKRFSALPPSKGGDEKEWIKAYVDVRHQWLKHHSRPILRGTVYRTNTFKKLIAEDNWDLNGKITTGNGCVVV